MTPFIRHFWLFFVFVSMAVFAPADGATKAKTGADTRTAQSSSDGKTVHLDRLSERKGRSGSGVNAFEKKSWYVPPPPKPMAALPPPPPPPPTAPPLPYTYLGSYQSDGLIIVFLASGDKIYTVSPGDVLDGVYRVEGIAAGRLELIYLPLNIKQTMNIGEVS